MTNINVVIFIHHWPSKFSSCSLNLKIHFFFN